MAVKLDNAMEKVRNSVDSLCETIARQHEICIQMLEGKEYQTLYKVMKKEQRILRMKDVIDHQVNELTKRMQAARLDTRELAFYAHIAASLAAIKDNARSVAQFANHCEDARAKEVVRQLELALADALRKLGKLCQSTSARRVQAVARRIEEAELLFAQFQREMVPGALKQGLAQSVWQTLCCIRSICEQADQLYAMTWMQKRDAMRNC